MTKINDTKTKTVFQWTEDNDERWSPNGSYPEGHAIRGFSYYSYRSWRELDLSDDLDYFGVDTVNDITDEQAIEMFKFRHRRNEIWTTNSYKIRKTVVTETHEKDDETEDESFEATSKVSRTTIIAEYYRSETDWEAALVQRRIDEERWAAADAKRAEQATVHKVETNTNFDAILSDTAVIDTSKAQIFSLFR